MVVQEIGDRVLHEEMLRNIVGNTVQAVGMNHEGKADWLIPCVSTTTITATEQDNHFAGRAGVQSKSYKSWNQ